MKKGIVNLLKYNKTVYKVYYYAMNICLAALGKIVRTDNKLILFNSYAGRKYDDSPKAIFEEMREDVRFKGYRFVWAFHEPDRFVVEGAEKIKTDSFLYFKTALSARVWVTNSSVERGLRFKKKNTFYLNTWHGTPIKKMGSDIATDNQSFGSKGKNRTDVMNTQSYFEADVYSQCFGIPRNHFLEVGLPRNDALVKYSVEEREEIRRKLGLPADKMVILYCPTFREYEKDENLGVVLAPPMNLNIWKRELADKYILLFRAHYEVSRIMEIQENNFVRNMTDYPILNDLMIASDILISDYSSIFFDYSIMDKCMLHFTYDFSKYEEKRGMYFDIRVYISGADNEKDLIDILKKMTFEDEVERTKLFREQYMNFYGDATRQTVNCIADHIL